METNDKEKEKIDGTHIYEEIYGSLRKRVTNTYILGWLIVTLFEIAFGVVRVFIIKDSSDLGYYFLMNVLLPSGLDALIIAVALILVNSSKVDHAIKNYALILSLILVSTVLSCLHGYYIVVAGLFVIPILLATVFLEYRFLVFSIIGSTLGLLVSTTINLFTFQANNKLHFGVSSLIIFLIMILFSSISLIIILVHKKRELTLLKVQTENAKLSKESKFDGLTGLQNHSSFYNVLENKLMKARHEKKGFALAVLDIDDFKDVNDTYGHAAGDEILKFVSETIVNVIEKNGVVFRYGGDEFAIIFHNPDPDANVRSLEHIRMVIESNDTMLIGGAGNITLSIGYYNVKEVIMSSEEIFYRADQALYQAKSNGKNQVYSVF